MNYKIFVLSAAFALGAAAVNAQEVATWAGFRSGAATFTFDDNCSNQFTIAVPIFDKYGYKASFYPVINWSPNWSTLQTLVNNGHEVGSHSVSHGQVISDSEISSSKNTINSYITGQDCNTITYPNCNEPSESELQKYYLGGRTCSGQIVPKTPSNYYQISSIICGNTGSVNSSTAFQGKMQEAINSNGWAVFLIHEVESGSGYSPTSSDAIEGALSWASQNDDKIWITTFRNAILYSKERDKASITKTTSTSSNETYSVSVGSLDVATYNYPLTVRVQNSNNWTNANVTQGSLSATATISGGYIYFEATPGAGDLVLSNADAIESSSSVPSSSSSVAEEPSSSSETPESIASLGKASPISVSSESNRIVINGAEGKTIAVFNSLGNLVKQTRCISGSQVIALGAKGMFIVKIGNKTWNVRQ